MHFKSHLFVQPVRPGRWVGNRAAWVIETLTDAGPAPCQSRQTLEIVHNFGQAVHCSPHVPVHVYNLFAAHDGQRACRRSCLWCSCQRWHSASSYMEKHIRNILRFCSKFQRQFRNFRSYSDVLWSKRCNAKVAMQRLCSTRTKEHTFSFCI